MQYRKKNKDFKNKQLMNMDKLTNHRAENASKWENIQTENNEL